MFATADSSEQKTGPTQAESSASIALRAELEALQSSPWYQLSSLQQHGKEVGVSPQKLAEATGRPNPKKELVTLILEASDTTHSSDGSN